MRHKDRVAVVIGAGYSHGRTISKRLAKEGAFVTVCDIEADGAKQVAEEIINEGGKALAVQCDVAKKADIDRVFDLTLQKQKKVDILVCNAAVCTAKSLLDQDEKTLDAILAVNIKGTFLSVQRAAREMLKHKWGRILLASSGAGMRGIRYLSAYSATKGALIRLAEAWSRELLPYGITVNAYSPGWTPHSFIGNTTIKELQKYYSVSEEEFTRRHLAGSPTQKEGNPEDTAALISFLCSDEAASMSGQMLLTDYGICFGSEMITL